MSDETSESNTALISNEAMGSVEKFLSSLGDNVPKLVPSTVKKIDKGLSTYVEGLFNLAWGRGLEQWNLRQELIARKNSEKLISEFDSMDTDDVIESPPEIAVPILQQLGYTDDAILSDILIQLLTSSASKKYVSLVHPSLVTVTSNISPDEALILKTFASLVKTDNVNEGSIPMINIKYDEIRPERSGSYRILAEYYSRLNKLEGLIFPRNVEFYVGNLISLGLFSRNDGYLGANEVDDTIHPDYEILQNQAKFDFPENPEFFHWTGKKFNFSLTKKGLMLIKAMDKAIQS